EGWRGRRAPALPRASYESGGRAPERPEKWSPRARVASGELGVAEVREAARGEVVSAGASCSLGGNRGKLFGALRVSLLVSDDAQLQSRGNFLVLGGDSLGQLVGFGESRAGFGQL